MGQETTIRDDERDELASEKGEVSGEAMEAIGVGVNAIQMGKGGQDHSTEDHEKEMPRDGVGAIQDESLIKEDVARIVGENAGDDSADVVHLNDGE